MENEHYIIVTRLILLFEFGIQIDHLNDECNTYRQSENILPKYLSN